VPASVILKCFDWAIEQREAGNCIISGFHSQLERDVFHYLLKGTQPIIIAMARGIPDKLPVSLRTPVEEGRILIISPFEKSITKVTNETAILRNKMMIEIAEKIVVGFADPKGKLNDVLCNVKNGIIYL
jgi:hypothetical protein